MGFQDRDYYREDAPTWWSRTAGTRATTAVMLALILVFVAQVLGSNPARGRPDQILAAARLDPAAVAGGQLWRLVTAHLVHDRSAFLLVALTAWALYYFGHRVEAAIGTPDTVAFLLAGALTLSASQLLADRLGGGAVGFSHGSGPLLVALLVLFVCLFPRDQAFLVIAMPAWVLAGLVAALVLVGEFGGGLARGGLAAYATAAFWGVIYARLDRPLARFQGRRPVAARATRLKLFRTPPEASVADPADERAARDILGAYTPRDPARSASALDEHLEAKLDMVLEKVSRSGRESLTADEQAILSRASEVYKQRKKSPN